MSIIITDLSYQYFNQPTLFKHISFSVEQGNKVSIIGNNGVGKSTLIKLLAGDITPTSGSINSSSTPYYVPQQVSQSYKTVAESLGVSKKLNVLNAIYNGSVNQLDYDILNDDWEIENRCKTSLSEWGLNDIELTDSMSRLSGGEKTKVTLAGISIHNPNIILLDEPTNHLDLEARKLLYKLVSNTKATVVIVSHDITLLNLLNSTYELSPKGTKLYGGNYDFYKEQKIIEDSALEQQVDAEQTTLRIARKRSQDVRERQDRRSAQGKRDKQKGGDPRIILNARANLAENSSTKIRDKHSKIINDSQNRLSNLREKQMQNRELKIDFEDAKLRKNKILITTKKLNFGYSKDNLLWSSDINLEIRSGQRIHLTGNNGSGKTTLIKLLLGELEPTQGIVTKSNFTYAYLDQEYELINKPLTILELAEQHNINNMLEHEVKLRLNRSLFPQDTWDKNCQTLSGGERMRLYLCCLMISNQVPDLFILDEPTNNLDISSLSILSNTIKNYKGTILIISHDEYFINEVGVTSEIGF